MTVSKISNSAPIIAWLNHYNNNVITELNLAPTKYLPYDAGGSTNSGFFYGFNTTTSGDPGTGKFLFNNATFGSATTVSFSKTDSGNNDLSTYLTSVDDSGSTNKAFVNVLGYDAGNFYTFYITSTLTDNGTYDTFNITPIASGGSVANTELCRVLFVPLGEQGSTGPVGPAGSSGGFPYQFNTSTSGDPGSGYFLVNNGTFGSVTTLHISYTDSSAANLQTFIEAVDVSSSNNKLLLVILGGTPGDFQTYWVTDALSDQTTYGTWSVTPIDSGGTISNGEACNILFLPIGDKGDTGLTGNTGSTGPTGNTGPIGAATYVLSVTDEVTPITAGTNKISFRTISAMTLSEVRASLTTAQTSGDIFTVDINENGSTILSTKLTIDNGEKTSTTAAANAVISDSSLADDSEITIDIDQVGDGTAKGLKVYLIPG